MRTLLSICRVWLETKVKVLLNLMVLRYWLWSLLQLNDAVKLPTWQAATVLLAGTMAPPLGTVMKLPETRRLVAVTRLTVRLPPQVTTRYEYR